MIRHAWLQKHSSPSAADGSFHWHPAAGDRELRASLVERARGVDPPAVIWELAPGRVCWAQAFAATAPGDHRRYTGLVLTVVERAGASVTELLAELVLPAAAPWTAGGPAPLAAALTEPAGASDVEPAELARLARTLLSGDGQLDRSGGGSHVVRWSDSGGDGRGDGALAAKVAALEVMLPADVRARVRRGVWRPAAPGAARSRDRVAMLLAVACEAPDSRAGQAWRLLGELASAMGCTVDEVAAQLAALEETDLATTLHDWGRGRLDGTATPEALAVRFADALALRVLARLIEDRDPAPVIAAARWHALLPAAHRARLFATWVRRCPSVRVLEGGARA